MTQALPQTSLYDRDFVAWCDDAVAKLKAGQLAEIDLENLIEEIEGLAGRDRREVRSRLDVLLAHLLKRIYVENFADWRGWENTIHEQRRELRILLEQSPSLRNHFIQSFDSSWQSALGNLRINYPEVQFPDIWPFSREIEALLSERFWQQ